MRCHWQNQSDGWFRWMARSFSLPYSFGSQSAPIFCFVESSLNACVWFSGDDALNDDGLLLIVVRGKRGLIKMRLHEVEAQCAKNRGEREAKNLTLVEFARKLSATCTWQIIIVK